MMFNEHYTCNANRTIARRRHVWKGYETSNHRSAKETCNSISSFMSLNSVVASCLEAWCLGGQLKPGVEKPSSNIQNLELPYSLPYITMAINIERTYFVQKMRSALALNAIEMSDALSGALTLCAVFNGVASGGIVATAVQL